MESTNFKTRGVVSDEMIENTTFYYSNFKLFPDDSELLFASYLSFKKNLQAFLGDDWESYAKKSLYSTIDDSTIFVQSRDIFDSALEVWLELRREINLIEDEVSKKQSEKLALQQKNPAAIDENRQDPQHVAKDGDDSKKSFEEIEDFPKLQLFEEEHKEIYGEIVTEKETHSMEEIVEDLKGFDTFQQKVRERYSQTNIDEAFFRAVIHAFYISAIKVWKTTLANYSCNSGFQNLNFFEESKRFLLSKLQSVYQTKFKALKPLLVATEKIKDYIYNDDKNATTPSSMNDQDKKNVDNFSSSMRFENSSSLHIPIPMYAPLNKLKLDDEQELKTSFNNLRISPAENTSSLLGKRTAMQAHSNVEIKKVNKKTEKLLNPNMIEFAAHYVNTMTKTTSLDWQISRTFVTNMVEVNYNKLVQFENRLNTKADELKNNVKIRFIQPAQEFYNSLMEAWIIFKTMSLNKEVLFTEYLDKVKIILGAVWNEKFLIATHNFFMTLYYEWNHLKRIEVDTEEKILLFIKKVKENMMKIWEDNIVKRAEELTNKKIN
jgi:hypothetical protein